MPSCKLLCPTCNVPLQQQTTENYFECIKKIGKIVNKNEVKYNHFDIKFEDNQISYLHWEHKDFAALINTNINTNIAILWLSKTELLQFEIEIPTNVNLTELLNTIQYSANQLIKFQSFL